jgi:peptide/nickel transport system substrate-binding protein
LLIFDTLTDIDDSGNVHAALATSWQAAPGNQRWQFRLRRDVKFHDGTLLTPATVASCLRTANPSWKVLPDADSIVIERDTPAPNLPAELALPRNAIAKRSADGTISGTGPFHITDWRPGKRLTLAAEENCWRGRPFLDIVEIEMGKNFRDQLVGLELGRAGLVEVTVEQAHRISAQGAHVTASAAIQLMALLFARDAHSPEERLLRDALAVCVDRASIHSVLLQGTGEPSASILPNWMTGYGFVFPTEPDLPRARREREQVRTIPAWSIGYDANDSIARLLVERIALNARDVGLVLQTNTSSSADLRLVRLSIVSPDPWIALANMAAAAGLPIAAAAGDSVQDLYRAEQALLATQRLIPLFHLPATYASTKSLRDWSVSANGSWRLADAWLTSERAGGEKQ